MARVAFNESFFKELSMLSREEGQHQLAKFLGLPCYDSDDLPATIKVDCIYDAVTFCTEHGFLWREMCYIVHLVSSMLDICGSENLIEGVCRYKCLCEDLQFVVDTCRLAVFTDYFFATFFTHYRLYQLVTSGLPPRDKLSTCLHLPLQPMPCQFPSLNEGRDVEVWAYERKIQALDQQELIAREFRRVDRDAVVEEDHAKLSEVHSTCNGRLASEPLSKQAVLEIIMEVANAHITAATHTIQHNIRETMEDISFLIDKTFVPRPSVLGPPPRISAKSVTSVVKTVPKTSSVDSTTLDKVESAKQRNITRDSNRSSKQSKVKPDKK